MVDDGQIVLVAGAIHLIALSLVGVLLWGAARSRARDETGCSDADSGDDEGGGGGNDRRRPPDRPRGGPPLPDADPARVRLRGPARLADLLPAPPRRAVREPARRTAPITGPRRTA